MGKKNLAWIVAGIIGMMTSVLHAIGGQSTLMDPILQSEVKAQVKVEMFGAWHLITVILFMSAGALLVYGIRWRKFYNFSIVSFIGWFYGLAGASFIFSSFYFNQFAPQFTLLLPISVLVFLGFNAKRVIR